MCIRDSSDGDESVSVLEKAQFEAQEIAVKCGLNLDILPLRSVGVQGDSRTYAHPAVVSGDSDWSTLEELSTELTNSFISINRVIYLLGPQKRPTQVLKKGYLTRDRLDRCVKPTSL